MGSDWRWGFVCLSHPTGAPLYSDPERGVSRAEAEKLLGQREVLRQLDSDFWSQEHYMLIVFLAQHAGCEVALAGPNGEHEPQAARPSGGELPHGVQEFGEPMVGQFVDDARRRGIAWIGEEQILRALGASGQGFRVRSVFVDAAREGVGVIVTHHNLPVVEDFARPTELRARWEWADGVHLERPDDPMSPAEICVRPRLLIDQLPTG